MIPPLSTSAAAPCTTENSPWIQHPLQRAGAFFKVLCAVALASLFSLGSASAATFTWNGGQGGGAGYWSQKKNWNNTQLSSGTTNDFIFAGTTQLNTTNDLTNLYATSIVFTNGAGAFILNASNAVSNTITLLGGITNLSGNNQTINLGLILGTNSGVIMNAASNNLTINGVITDGANSYGIVKAGTNDLFLTAANTFDAGITLNAGRIFASNNAALGTGTLTFASNNTTLAASTSLSLTNAMVMTGSGTIDNGGFLLTNGGAISGAGALAFAGAGTTILSGTNTNNGAFTLSGGKLTITGSNSVGVTQANGTTLELQANAGNTTSNVSKAMGGTWGLSGASGNATLRLLSDTSVTFNGGDNGSVPGNWGTVNFYVGNINAGNSNNVISFATNGFNLIGMTFNFDGTNGYSMAMGNLTNVGGAGATIALNANSASASINSVVGNGSASSQYTLALGGTNTGANVIQNGVAGASGQLATLSKSGTGTWNINGSSSYLGNTTISGGTLVIGGVLNSGASATTGTYSGTINNTGTLILSNSAAQTLSGNISGAAGVLAKQNAGLLTLSGSNSYTGVTTVGGGVIDFANTNALYGGVTNSWTAANLKASNGGALIFGVTNFGTAKLSPLFTTLTNTASQGILSGGMIGYDTTGTNYTISTTLGNGINGAVGYAAAGSGTLTLNASNSFTGGFQMIGGNLVLGNANALGAGTLIWGGGNINLNGYTLTNAVSLTSSAVMTNTGSQTLSGAISGTGAFTQNGTGTTVFSGVNTYSGASTLTAGTLQFNGASAMSGNSTLSFGGGTLSLRSDANATFAPASFNGGSINTTASISADQLTSGGANGSKTLTLNMQSAQFNGGTLNLTSGSGDVLALSALTIAGNATFNTTTGSKASVTSLTDNANSLPNVTFTGGGDLIMGGMTNGYANRVFYLYFNQTGTVTLATNNVLKGSGGGANPTVNFNGGTTILNNGSALYGSSLPAITVGNGSSNVTVLLGGTDAAGVAGGVTFSQSQTVSNTNGLVSIGGNNTSGTNTWSGTFTLGTTTAGANLNLVASTGGTVIISGALTNFASSTNGALTINAGYTQDGTNVSPAGTVVLSASNTFVGGTTVNAGTLVVSNAYALGSAATNFTVNAATANLGSYNFSFGRIALGNGTISGVGNLTNTGVTATNSGSALIANNLVGSGGFTQSGGGTTTLSGNNTYSGATVVSSGGLQVNGSLGSSSLSLSSATLSMTNLSSVAYNFTNGITLGSAVALSFDVIGATNDSIATTSGLTFSNSTVTVNILSSGLVGGTTNTLMSWGSASGTGSFILGTTNALGFGVTSLTLQTNATSLQVVINGTSINGAAYWVGNLGNTWTTNTGTVGNFSTNAGALTGNATANPAAQTDVYFTNTSSQGLVSNTLGGTFAIRSLNFTGTGTTTIGNDGNTLSIASGGLNVSSGSTATVGESIIGTGGVTNNGTLILSGSNSFTGTTLAQSGSLILSNNNALAGSVVNIASNNALSFASGLTSFNIAGLSGSSSLSLTNGSGSAVALSVTGSGTQTFAGSMGGTGSFVVSGLGTQYLTGSNTFSGGTTVSAGKLVLGVNNALLGTGTVSVTAGTFDLAGYNQTLAALSGSGVVTSSTGNGALTLSNNAAITVANNLTGGLVLVKAGGGTTTISVANSYTGGTTINAGQLYLTANNGLGSGNITINNGGWLQLANNLTLTNNLAVSGNTTLTEVSAGGGNFSGNLSGSGTLIYFNNGTAGGFNVTGSNGAFNGTFIEAYQQYGNNNGSPMTFGSANAGSANASWVFNDAGDNQRLNVNIGSGTISFGSLAGNAQMNDNASGAGTTTISVGANNSNSSFNGYFKQANTNNIMALQKVGTGTLTLGASATYPNNNGPTILYAGGTTINAGALVAGSATAFGTGTLTIAGGTANLGGFTLTNTLATVTGGSLTNGTISNNAGTYTFNSASNVTVAAVLAGSNGLAQSGNGTTTLSGNNTFSGGTTINGGTLAVSSTGLGSGSLTLNGGGLVDNGTTTSITNAINVASNSQIRVSSAGGSLTLNGNISGNGNIGYISDNFAGNLYLGGNNSGFSGTFTQNYGVNGTALNFTSANAGSAGASWVLNDNNDNNRVNLSFGNGTISFGSLSGPAQINDTATGVGTTTIRVGDLGTSTSYSGYFMQANSNNQLALLKVGSGTLTLNASATYPNHYGGTIAYAGGTVVNGGTLLAGANNAFGSGTITISSGATLALGSYNASNSAVTLNDGGTISGNGTLNANTYSASGGSISSSLAGGSFTKTSAGTLTISSINNTFSGGMTVSGGSINYSNGGAFGSGTVSLAGGTSLNYTGGTATASVGNAISVTSGTGLLQNSTLSQLTLSGTLQSGGTALNLSGGSFNVTGAITGVGGLNLLGAAVTLGNSGNSFVGPISLSSGSTLTAGAVNALPTSGILTIGVAGDSSSVTNSFNLNGNNQTLVSIADSGSGFNQILNNGASANLTLTGNSTYNGQINGNLGLNLSGGSNNLGGNNGFNGGTTLNNGATVSINNGSALGSGLVSVGDGAAVNYTGGNSTIANNFVVPTNGLGMIKNSGNGMLTLSGTLTKQASILELAGGSFNITGRIAGNSGGFNSDLYVSNAVVTLANASNNYYGPTKVFAGSTLIEGANNALPTSTILSLGSSSDAVAAVNTLDLNGKNQSLSGLYSSGPGINQIISRASGANTLTLTGASSFGGSISGANLSLNVSSGSGTVSLTGANDYQGTTMVNSGRLSLGASGSLSGTTAVTVASGATLLLGGNNQVNTNATVSLGGTLSMGAGTNRASQTFSTLTLTGNSVIDFANLSGTSLLTFSSINLAGYTLTINNWSGTNQYGQTSNGDSTFLYDLSSLTGTELNNIRFFGTDGSFLGQGSFSTNNQIVPVPEPGVIIAAFMLLGLLVWSNRGTIRALSVRRA